MQYVKLLSSGGGWRGKLLPIPMSSIIDEDFPLFLLELRDLLNKYHYTFSTHLKLLKFLHSKSYVSEVVDTAQGLQTINYVQRSDDEQ